jgi:hypothetical protein
MPKHCVALLLLSASLAAQSNLHINEKPKITLEQALPIARQAALANVPDLDKFILHSVQPSGMFGDKRKYWRFQWQELPVKTDMRGLIVRVDVNDGATEVISYTE